MTEKSNDLQQQILHYLQRNPRAAETAGGVNRVWLRRPHIPDAVIEVEQALRKLVLAGEVERHDLPGGEKVYRRVERTSS
jgi:hypothetical protein